MIARMILLKSIFSYTDETPAIPVKSRVCGLFIGYSKMVDHFVITYKVNFFYIISRKSLSNQPDLNRFDPLSESYRAGSKPCCHPSCPADTLNITAIL